MVATVNFCDQKSTLSSNFVHSYFEQELAVFRWMFTAKSKKELVWWLSMVKTTLHGGYIGGKGELAKVEG